MPTYVLDENTTVNLPNGPVAVNTTTAQLNPPVRLTARTMATGDGVRTVSSTPTMLILPGITEETVIGAVPDQGHERFPVGTVLNVTISPDAAPGSITDSAALPARDVSGLTRVDLASVADDGQGQLIVRSLLAVADPALPPVGASARIGARGVMGMDRVSPAKALRVRCLVDTSASMAEPFARQAVAACADIVAGLASVISTDQTLDFTVLAPGTQPQRMDPAAMGDAVAQPPAAGWGLGSPISELLAQPTSPRTVTILITDGIGTVPRVASPADRPVITLAITDVHSPSLFVGPTAICRPGASDQADVRAFLGTRPDLVNAIVAELIGPLRKAGLLP